MRDANDRPPGCPQASPDEIALAAFIDTALDKLRRGEPVVVEELLPTRPDLIPRCRELVRDLAALRNEAPTLTPNPVPAAAAVPCDPFPGEFRIRRLLGEGAFGKVWLADDLVLGRPVALKTLRVPAGSDDAAPALAALRKEAQFLAGVHHPNVVQVYGWRQGGDEHYLVLQYVAGGSLHDLVKKEGPLAWQRAARYAADVGEGLLAVHAAGVVHRDIKPENILLDAGRDEALLSDFGISGRLASARTVAGTPMYMAPEARFGRATAASDVYSLAATLFRLAAGETPFPGPTLGELSDQIQRGLPDPDPRCAVMPESLERVIRSGLAADAGRRPALRMFVDTLRGGFNQALADDLAGAASPVGLRLIVSRPAGRGGWSPVAATLAPAGPIKRDIKKVPPPPERVGVRTGERVRVEVSADREGFVTVFNVGPTGNLNLLHPNQPAAPGAPPDVKPGRPLTVLDVEFSPPAGRERLFAVWSREPLPLRLEEMRGLAEGGRAGEEGSRPYRATRDMKRVKEAVQQVGPAGCQVVVLELEHAAAV